MVDIRGQSGEFSDSRYWVLPPAASARASLPQPALHLDNYFSKRKHEIELEILNLTNDK